MTQPRMKREKIEMLMRITIGPVIKGFAKKHFPDIKKGMCKDLTDGVADYIASSFETYQDDIEEEALEFNEYNQTPIPLEKCTVDDL